MTEQRYTMDSYGRIVAADMGLTRYIKVEDTFKCETCKHGDNGLCNSFMWCEFHEEYRPDMRKLNVTADVQEVKHGHWIAQVDGTHFCSECGKDALYALITYNTIEVSFKENQTDICPHCGAKMEVNHE